MDFFQQNQFCAWFFIYFIRHLYERDKIFACMRATFLKKKNQLQHSHSLSTVDVNLKLNKPVSKWEFISRKPLCLRKLVESIFLGCMKPLLKLLNTLNNLCQDTKFYYYTSIHKVLTALSYNWAKSQLTLIIWLWRYNKQHLLYLFEISAKFLL